jgi:hypothetical protein
LQYSNGYKLYFGHPIYLQGYTPIEGARCLNQSVEDLVRRSPEQYLWSYNRYKVPPDVAPPGMQTVAVHSPVPDEDGEAAGTYPAGMPVRPQ